MIQLLAKQKNSFNLQIILTLIPFISLLFVRHNPQFSFFFLLSSTLAVIFYSPLVIYKFLQVELDKISKSQTEIQFELKKIHTHQVHFEDYFFKELEFIHKFVNGVDFEYKEMCREETGTLLSGIEEISENQTSIRDEIEDLCQTQAEFISELRQASKSVIGASYQESMSREENLIFKSYVQEISHISLKDIQESKDLSLINFIFESSIKIVKNLEFNDICQNAALNYIRAFAFEETFDNIDFNRTNLKFIDFHDFQFSETLFVRSNLEEASFYLSALFDCDFSNANLSKANFSKTELEGTNFNNAKMQNTNFDDANFIGVNLFNLDLSGALNLEFDQVILADNWQSAYYEPELDEMVSSYTNEILLAIAMFHTTVIDRAYNFKQLFCLKDEFVDISYLKL